MSFVGVLLIAVLVLLLRIASVVPGVALLVGDCVCRQSLVVVGHRGAYQASEQESASDKKHTKISEAVEEGCHQVTVPRSITKSFSCLPTLGVCQMVGARLRSAP